MTAAALSAFAARAQATMEAVFPCTIRLGASATDLAAATVGLKQADSLDIGGILLEPQISFRLRKSLAPTRPPLGTRLHWVERSLTFAVDEVRDTNGDAAWLLVCKSPHAR